MKLSIIIPALNEEASLPETLANVSTCAPEAEVILVDGGSADRTKQIAAEWTGVPIRVLDSPRGRGNQMNLGAIHATGDVLLFLHADTQAPHNVSELIARALADPAVIGGNFRIRFLPHAPIVDLYAWLYNLRTFAHIFYGDSAIFVRRDVFEQMGGYRPALIMEDIDLVRRLRRTGRLAYIRGAAVTTSARRFAHTGTALKMLIVWSLLHILLDLGVKQETLEALYPPVR